MTTGSRWPLSRPLNDDERTWVQHTGVCMGCHRNMASPEFWQNGALVEYGQVASTDEHIDARKEMTIDAVAADGRVQMPECPSQVDLAAAKRAAADPQSAVQKQKQALPAGPEETAADQADTEAVKADLDAAKAEVDTLKGEIKENRSRPYRF